MLNDEVRARAVQGACRAAQRWSEVCAAAQAYIQETPDLSRNLRFADLRARLENSIGWIGLRLLSADGPVDDVGANLLNIVRGRSATAAGYAAALSSPEAEPLAASVANLALLMEASSAQERHATGSYDRLHDPVIAVVQDIADALFLSDGSISLHEAEVLADVVGSLRGEAERIPRTKAPAPAPDAPLTSTSPPAPAAQPPTGEGDDPLAELHGLIGLASVKRQVETLVNLARQIKLRRDHGLPTPTISFHSAFTGRPGTGKTTVARIVARIYKELGLISQGQVVETDRSGLVAGYVGQTAAKVAQVAGTAEGGVLFIDEAYALSPNAGNDYGGEAIETLLKLMEDKRDNLIVIAAGYSDRMATFLASNPGLRSRFANVIEFPDYSAEEMAAIFESLAASGGYVLGDEAAGQPRNVFGNVDRTSAEFANGRDVRNLLEKAIAAQADRLAAVTNLDVAALQALTAADIASAAAACEVTVKAAPEPGVLTQPLPNTLSQDDEPSWLEAILKVLGEAGAPMSYTAIADRVVGERVKLKVGSKPAATVAAVISNALDRPDAPLRRVRRGEYALVEAQCGDAPSR